MFLQSKVSKSLKMFYKDYSGCSQIALIDRTMITLVLGKYNPYGSYLCHFQPILKVDTNLTILGDHQSRGGN